MWFLLLHFENSLQTHLSPFRKKLAVTVMTATHQALRKNQLNLNQLRMNRSQKSLITGKLDRLIGQQMQMTLSIPPTAPA